MGDEETTPRTAKFRAVALLEDEKKKDNEASWSREQEHILKIWAEKAAGYRWLHEQSARHYRLLNNRFVYPQIVLSTLAGAGGVGLSSSENSVGFGYAIAMVNIFIALLTSFQKFAMAAEKSEKHGTTGSQFASFYRNITLELSLHPRDRTECLELCKASRSEYDRLMSIAPNVPLKIITRFNAKFPHAKNKPDIANGLSDMQVWAKTDETLYQEAFVKMKSFYKLLYGQFQHRERKKSLPPPLETHFIDIPA
jgi:hypothetical protein